jgi:DnaK suppressor protein
MPHKTVRNTGLRQILLDYRRTMLDGVRSSIRDGRADRAAEVRDFAEHSDADVQGDIEFTLLQARADTLVRIDEALTRLAAGKYGACADCEGEISERRLRALPFAVRCQACESTREELHLQAQQRTQHDARLSSFREAVGW